jgi:endo-1,3-1,4-beta-glycanase ExoK
MSRPISVLVCGGVVAAIVSACSGNDNPVVPGASPGGSATGQGGANASNGGAANSNTGGSATGGTNSNGKGGSTTGGKAAGGTSTRGASTAGSSIGGTANSNTGGSATGGTNSNGKGGSTTGGKAAGGTSTGGSSTAGSSIGGTATGGKAAGGTSTGGAATTAAGATGSFVLAWEDNFDRFDSSLWQLMTHTWDGNLAQFSATNTSVASGILSVNLTSQPSDTTKPYRGVEMRSTKTLTYGKISARIRFAKGAGVVSGLVAIYTPWPADNWNEIDIEHIGKTPTSTQLNCMVYTGAPTTPPVTTSVTPTQDPLIVSPGFDAEATFHQYDIEWTTADVRFYMDGTLGRIWNKEIARMTLPQNILFTIWASNSADWAGALTSSSAPTSAEIDWIRVYDWKG